ncbi:pyridoxal phosphate-dependent aminotransferase [Devosia sp. 919]|uniref:pyridoxal phosphate-dependent aminotransferase n=1 Tax=Devosia sp. 919 TaxID=2726065 RepID=UPI001557AAA8|nr:pyridoxal phosphate-dependent aminotransferase [Devosia sp. 919]
MHQHLASPPQARQAVLDLAPSRIREVANAGMDRSDVVPFWFGESDQPTPAFIRAATVESLERNNTFYTQNLGRPALRTAIASYISQLRNITLGPDRVGVTSSGVSALMLGSQLVLSPGDRVVVVTPIWPNIAEIPKILGAEVTRFPLSVINNRWQLDLDHLLATLTDDVRMLVINSPNNPTGWTITPEQQAAILAHCRQRGIWILSDEVYDRLVFTPGQTAAPSMLSVADPQDRLIVVNSFSKTWRMTGWRLGWLVLPTNLVPQLEKLIEYNTSCVPEFVQAGGLAALTDPASAATVTQIHRELGEARATLLTALRQLPGVTLPEADGAMYAFFRVDGHADSLALAKRLVAEAGLGLAPGSAFGDEGEGWLRWCFAAAPERIDTGVDRLRSFLRQS